MIAKAEEKHSDCRQVEDSVCHREQDFVWVQRNQESLITVGNYSKQKSNSALTQEKITKFSKFHSNSRIIRIQRKKNNGRIYSILTWYLGSWALPEIKLNVKQKHAALISTHFHLRHCQVHRKYLRVHFTSDESINPRMQAGLQLSCTFAHANYPQNKRINALWKKEI